MIGKGIWDIARIGLLLALAGVLVSCDDPQKRALRDLTRAGIEPTGQALLDAVVKQDARLIEWLVTAQVHLDLRDAEGRTPLRVSVDAGDKQTALRLIEAGANVNVAADDGASVLGVVLERGERDLISKVIEAGGKSDGLMLSGERILPWVIQQGQMEWVRGLMGAKSDPHLTDRKGNPLLHVAMGANHRDLTKELIRKGADPGQLSVEGESTLQVAIRNRWLDVIPELVSAGADPNLPGPMSMTPLAEAVVAADVELVAALLKAGADPNFRHPAAEAGEGSLSSKSPLELAFAHADRRVFGAFLDSRVAFGQETVDGWLLDAVTSGDRELARMLLSHGANPASRAGGWLPIEAAAAGERGSLVKLLADYGSPAGRAVHVAAVKGDRAMVELLLSLGMSPDVVEPPFVDRPLSLAIRAGKDEAAEALVRRGAKIDFKLPEGQTPLHLAVAKGSSRTVRALLERGADPNVEFTLPVSADFIRQVRPGVVRWALKADGNMTLLMVAADTGNTKTARYLLQAGAKRSTWTKVSRLWPINFASRRGDVKMMRLILGKDPYREKRHIVVNLREQRARMFDAEGNEIFTTKVSTGKKGHATPTGEYVITNKHRDWTSTIYHAKMPYFQRLSCSDIGLHAGVVPGYPASHGCIRVPAANAAKLFAMTEAGDRVMIVP